VPDLTAPMEDDRNWLLVMAALTAIELIWWMIEWGVGAAPAPLIATYGVLATGGLALGAALRFASGMRPSDADWPGVALGTALVAVGASVFLPLKYAIPSEVPFWLDHRLAIAERAIDVAPLVTGTVGLDGVAGAFDALADPEEHCKVLITP